MKKHVTRHLTYSCMKKVLLIPFFALLSVVGFSQELGYIQPVGIEIFNNPGFISSTSNRFKSNFRISNPGLNSQGLQHTTGYWHRFENIKSNIGAAYTSQQFSESDYKSNRIDLTYAFEWKINRKFSLIPSLSGAYVLNENQINSNYIDVSGGLVLKASQFFKVGYALHHYNQPEFEVAPSINAILIQRHNMFAIVQRKLNYKSRIAVFVNLNWQNGLESHFYGLLLQRKGIMIGGGINKDLHYMAMLRYRVQGLTLRYSYDAQNISGVNFTAHELGLEIKISRKPTYNFPSISF